MIRIPFAQDQWASYSSIVDVHCGDIIVFTDDAHDGKAALGTVVARNGGHDDEYWMTRAAVNTPKEVAVVRFDPRTMEEEDAEKWIWVHFTKLGIVRCNG